MTPLARVKAALEAAGCRASGEHVWTCPAHEDSRPSLSVSEGRDGRVLLKCHAGCGLPEILARLGLEKRELFADAPSGPSGKRREVAAYRYRDEGGKLLFEVVRFEPKGFGQRRPVSDGGRAYGLSAGRYVRGRHGDWIRYQPDLDRGGGETRELPEARRVLYRLPELLAAIGRGEAVYVVEGEKDADALAGLGLAATCNPQGAGKWRTEFSDSLRGARVRIVPDRDRPGEEHAAAVAASLSGVAAEVMVVRVPEGKDASEFLEVRRAAGLGPDALRAEFEGLPPSDREGPPPGGVVEVRSPVSGRERLPLRREIQPPEEFPVKVLPDLLRDAVRDIEARVQAPLALAAQSVLAVAAFVAQGRADVELPWHAGRRPLGLFLLSVAESGDRKTTADNLACEALEEREAELQDDHRSEKCKAGAERDAWEASRSLIKGDRKTSRAEKEARLFELGPEPVLPPWPDLRVTAPTWEGLCRVYREGRPSLGLFSSEGAGFVGGYAMNRDNALKTAAGLSDLWDGASLKTTTKGDGSSILPGRRLSIHLLMQPGVGVQFVGNAGLWDQGVMARFLPVWPQSLAGSRLLKEGPPPPREGLDRFKRRMLEGLRLPFPDGWRETGLRLPMLTLDAQGTEIIREFYNRVEREVREGGELAAVRGLANKAAEHAVRLAGVFAVAEDLGAHGVPARWVEAGCLVVGHYLSEALRLRADAEDSPEVKAAEKLEAWIAGRPGGRAGFREILKEGPRGSRIKAAAERQLALLEEHGRVVALGPGEVAGQRYGRVYEVVGSPDGGLS